MTLSAKSFGLDHRGFEIFLVRSIENSQDVAVLAQGPEGTVQAACLCEGGRNCTTRPEQYYALIETLGAKKQPHGHHPLRHLSERIPVKDGEIARFVATADTICEPLYEYRKAVSSEEWSVELHKRELEKAQQELAKQQQALARATEKLEAIQAAVGPKPEVQVPLLKDLV